MPVIPNIPPASRRSRGKTAVISVVVVLLVGAIVGGVAYLRSWSGVGAPDGAGDRIALLEREPVLAGLPGWMRTGYSTGDGSPGLGGHTQGNPYVSAFFDTHLKGGNANTNAIEKGFRDRYGSQYRVNTIEGYTELVLVNRASKVQAQVTLYLNGGEIRASMGVN